MDGYDKLSHFGFHLNDCIDGYALLLYATVDAVQDTMITLLHGAWEDQRSRHANISYMAQSPMHHVNIHLCRVPYHDMAHCVGGY